MLKASSSTGSWLLWDTARSPYNTLINMLVANTSSAEDTSNTNYKFDMFSNGFQPRGTAQSNTSGVTYIYACFAENPFALNARAR